MMPNTATTPLARPSHLLTASLVFLALLLSLLGQKSTAADLLPPEEAFTATAQVSGDTIDVLFQPAQGYYLYQDRISLEPQQDNVVLGAPDFPPAVTVDDPVFGETQVFKSDALVSIPVTQAPGGEAVVDIHFQGCSEEHGVCYPPQSTQATLNLAAVGDAQPDSTQPAAADNSGGGLGGLIGGGSSEPLDPEVAFVPSVDFSNDQIQIIYEIAPDYYLYQDRLLIGTDPADINLDAAPMPAAVEKDDPSFGLVEVYFDQVALKVGTERSEPFHLVIGYQGCADMGLCYPPMEKTYRVDPQARSIEPADDHSAELTPIVELAGAETTADTDAATTASIDDTAASSAEAPRSQTDLIADRLASDNLWVIVGWFLVIGLLLAFTPCVFPMIPILSGIIAGQGKNITTRKAFVLSLVYVLAMAVTYTIAGVLAGMFGANLQAAFQNPWILGTFAAIFVLLALSMFGFYELQLPSSIQSRIMHVQNRQEGGTLTGVAIMGFLSALIVGPCMAPPLAGALIYIGQTGDAVLGGAALFAMSIGMGLPLILVGTLGGKYMPRAGNWMNAVKAVFGVLLLAVAIWMIERVVPASVSQLLWAALLISAAVYMGTLEPIREGVSNWFRLWKSIGLVLLIWGVLLLIGVAAGAKGSPLAPLSGLGFGGGMQTTEQVQFEYVENEAELDALLEQAQAAGQPVMLDFTADWCTDCVRMERETFPDPQVVQALQGFKLIKVDVTDNTSEDRALLSRFDLFGPPGMIFWDQTGEPVRSHWLVGFQPPERFAPHVQEVANR